MNLSGNLSVRRDWLQPYIVEPTTTHKYTIILLHGLGSNGTKFGQELLETGRTSSGKTLPALLPGARFVFPTAKFRRSSAFGKQKVTQWFDIARLADPSYRKEKQLKGLADSAFEIRDLLHQEVEGVGPTNTIIGGISQGCGMSLSILLSLEFPLGGYIGMCGYLPFQRELHDALRGENEPQSDGEEVVIFSLSDDGHMETPDPAVRALAFERALLEIDPLPNAKINQTAVSTPVFLGHGDADETKPHILGEAAARTVREAGYSVDWKLYPGLGHWYKIPEEIDDIVTFIKEKVGWDIT
ncbi:acyl-protein thioesterase [Hypoxylon argillaceum]|nr:acyl-protein thioesterase [Hypoxylon argillaceum]